MIHISTEYLGQEEKAIMVESKVEALEAKAKKLRRDLITTMDDASTAREKATTLANKLKVKKQLTLQNDKQLQAANQKVKSMATKAVHAFQQTEEYNTMLFSWYYKDFKLLRQYMVKHSSEVNLEDLDFKEVDKEVEADEATQVATTALEENAPLGNDREPEDAPVDAASGDEVTV